VIVTLNTKKFDKCKLKDDNTGINAIANKHGITTENLTTFVNDIMQRMIFDGEQLTDLLAPLGLGWKQRRVKELALMEDLAPHLHKRAKGREISGLEAYE